MSFIGQPPGNILQNLYLSERIKFYQNQGHKNFLEIGSGNGFLSQLFLSRNYNGIGIDLNESACVNNIKYNKEYIDSGRYKVEIDDFFDFNFNEKFDVITSYMVIEHLEDNVVIDFFTRCKSLLNENGVIFIQVPSGMKYWGIEDEIAGHIKRYEFKDIDDLSIAANLKVINKVGLTYPVSNLLFSLSNRIIKKNESHKLKLSQKERTVYTGNRDVKFKTTFPKYANIILNPVVMYPFHMIQKFFKSSDKSMVIFAEFKNTDI